MTRATRRAILAFALAAVLWPTMPVGGEEPKLSGSEIESLLFGKEIKGRWFWFARRTWRQQRTADGVVEHSGNSPALDIRVAISVSVSRRPHDDFDRVCMLA